ncbi:SOS response-associated peptidase [Shinella sp. CPCC 101442]|uniref:SOS response-associated peptidase n=1 Tax=Shinella sp. CPCC 101442 TaxID=2932265 RepID=UPI00215347C5|nr:SOS response-associated peptidase [Shinella sp. CPCC 101442]MCR6498794.1 SOS response-associated peptidase [Shinella sp. CPCC 101442]
MCGRYALLAKTDLAEAFFDLAELDDLPARYNIAPTQPILIVVAGEKQQPGSNLPERRAMLVRWGFMPGWVKDPRDFPLLINARSETAIGKASFRAAMRHRRILVPASGFFEWRRPEDKSEKAQAYFIRPKKGEIVAFAGLMETWSSADGSEVDTGAILTAKANNDISRIHDRMPVVIRQEDFSRWLDCKTQEPRDILDLMKPIDDGFFEAIPVSDKVNKVANMRPDILEPVEERADPAPLKKKGTDAPPSSGQLSLF